MDTYKIGNFLQTLRKAKGLTQQDLADTFEVSNKTAYLYSSSLKEKSIQIKKN